MTSKQEREYISNNLIPEILDGFEDVSIEYQQSRDLGIRGEFASLYRKARKLKTIYWDGASDAGWREGTRIIIKEVVSHGLLMLVDFDKVGTATGREPFTTEEGADPDPVGRRYVPLTPSLREAAGKAIAGDPSDLEDSGHFLTDSQYAGTDHSCRVCEGEAHAFAGLCAFRINARRHGIAG